MKLTEKQKSVLNAVSNAAPGDFIVLRGFAGTGKSVTASEIMKSQNKKTLVITPTAAALAVLKRKIDGQKIKNVTFKTIASLMSRHQAVLKLGQFKDFYPVIGTREQVEALREFSSNDLQSVFDVEKEISELHPSLTLEEVEKSFTLKYLSRSQETVIKNEEHLKSFVAFEQEDPAFSYDNFILTIDTEKLSETFINVFKINPFDPITEDSQFDFKSVGEIISELDKYALVVIDEMSMMSEDQAEIYVKSIENCQDAPVTLVSGDPGQLKPVEGSFNRWCNLEEDGVKVFELTEILRSTDEVATLGQMIRMNVPIGTIASSDSRIFEFDKGTSINEIYSKYEDLFKQSDIALAFTNKDVNELNTKIRYSKGLIGQVQSGDKIVVNKNTGFVFGSGIVHANGQIYRVTQDLSTELLDVLTDMKSFNISIDKVKRALSSQQIKFIEVEDDEMMKKYILVSSNCYSLNSRDLKELDAIVNRSIRNNLAFHEIDRLNRFFETLQIDDVKSFKFPNLVDVKFAHAMTVHKSQGSQFKNVVYLVSNRDLWIQSKDLTDSRFKQAPVYVAITRAIENVTVFYVK